MEETWPKSFRPLQGLLRSWIKRKIRTKASRKRPKKFPSKRPRVRARTPQTRANLRVSLAGVATCVWLIGLSIARCALPRTKNAVGEIGKAQLILTVHVPRPKTRKRKPHLGPPGFKFAFTLHA